MGFGAFDQSLPLTHAGLVQFAEHLTGLLELGLQQLDQF